MLDKNTTKRLFLSYNKCPVKHEVKVTIDPCSWMYPHYGLQVTGFLETTHETIHPHLTRGSWENFTELDFENLCGTFYMDTPCACGNPRLRSNLAETNRGELCEICFLTKLNDEWEEATKKEKEEMELQDADMKEKGYTHKIVAWIHGGGDDKCVDVYFTGCPAKKDIEKVLEDSIVKNDYKLYAL
jgi:hypothetical protein